MWWPLMSEEGPKWDPQTSKFVFFFLFCFLIGLWCNGAKLGYWILRPDKCFWFFFRAEHVYVNMWYIIYDAWCCMLIFLWFKQKTLFFSRIRIACVSYIKEDRGKEPNPPGSVADYRRIVHHHSLPNAPGELLAPSPRHFGEAHLPIPF